MKNSFMYIFFILILVIAGSILIKLNSLPAFLIKQAIPAVQIIKNIDSGEISGFSYINILKYKMMSENIFIELPEDFAELEKEDVKDEIVKEEKLLNEESQVKSVTLEWKNEIRNETKYDIDVEKLKSEQLNFSLSNSGTEIIIYHTHTTEAYSQDENYQYVESGNFRTLDDAANVLAVGEHVKSTLEKLNINSFHDTSYYDYPSYNLSYSKAGKAILALVKKYTNAKIVLDIHRDALSTDTKIYRPVITVANKSVAQILLVVGTNQGGLNHPNWRENLKFALKLQQIANQKYPGLCRYVSLRKERFNQQVAPGAIIVEMGATGNTLDEVLRASELFAEILAEVVK